jgi:uncharacterized protein
MPPTEKQPDPPGTERLLISYPCTWTYKVVGADRLILREIITAACAELTVTISDSRSSASGRYYSLNVDVTVPDETTRLALYRTLTSHPEVKIVL